MPTIYRCAKCGTIITPYSNDGQRSSGAGLNDVDSGFWYCGEMCALAHADEARASVAQRKAEQDEYERGAAEGLKQARALVSEAIAEAGRVIATAIKSIRE